MEGKAFERLFRTYYPLLFRVAYDLLHDAEESHDVVHEVFAAVWSKGIEIQSQTEKAFLVRSVYNHCLNLIARKDREEKLRELYPLELAMSLKPDIEPQQLEQIYRYINEELPPNTREVLKLCFEEEKSYAEAASQLQMSVAYVNKHIVKALRLLRERFNPKKKQG